MSLEEKYKCQGISLYKIRNHNETRVVSLLPEVFKEYSDYQPDSLNIEDIYALSLNKLPARYVQAGTIILRHKRETSDEDIKQAIRESIETVMKHPKG